MKKFKWILYLLLVLIPLLVGYGINILITYAFVQNSEKLYSLCDALLKAWQYVAVIYWFIVGRVFANMNSKKRWNGIIYGNILWAISLLFFICKTYIVSNDLIVRIAVITDNYVLGFVSFSSKLLGIFSNTIHSSVAMFIAYTLMFMVFMLGYLSKIKSENRNF